MTSSIETFLNEQLNHFIFGVFQEHLCCNESMNYYLIKYSDTSKFNLTENEILRKCIYNGIMDDQFTDDDIQNEFGNDAECYLWEYVDEDNFPFKKMVEKFVKKNKSNILGKLIKLTGNLW